MIVFRRAPTPFPFLWESGADQPPARWHAEGEGPAQYLADTPDGAWAEFLRHEHINDPEDLPGLRETLWAVELPDDLGLAAPTLPGETLRGGLDSYTTCQQEARRLRRAGARGLRAPSAALVSGGARGWRVENGLREAPPRDGSLIVLYGAQPEATGWRACAEGRPDPLLLAKVRYLR